MVDDRPGEFKQLVAGLFREQRKGPVLTVSSLRQHWPGIVGEELARKTHPLRLRGKILWLATPDSSWAFNLQFVKEEMLDSVRTFLESEAIEELRFSVGEIPPRDESGEEEPAPASAADSASPPIPSPTSAPPENPSVPPAPPAPSRAVGSPGAESRAKGRAAGIGASIADEIGAKGGRGAGVGAGSSRPDSTEENTEESSATDATARNAAGPDTPGREIPDERLRNVFARTAAKQKQRRQARESDKKT